MTNGAAPPTSQAESFFKSGLLRLDLRERDVALPARGVALEKVVHLLRRARERIERRVGEELPGVPGGRDLVEPGRELLDDGPRRSRRDHDAPPGRDVVAAVTELGERRH